MPRRNERLVEELVKAPWWVSLIVGAGLFAAMRWLAPVLLRGNSILDVIGPALSKLAPLALGFCCILAVFSFVFGLTRRRLLDRQTSLESLRETSWRQFELLVAEAYRRRGFQVDFNMGGGMDGGVDVTLRKGGRTTLVQCKQWKVHKIGAPVVRELLGAMTATHAHAGIVITTGQFTREAQTFAAGKPLELVDGHGLLELVRAVKENPLPRAAVEEPNAPPSQGMPPSAAVPLCPLCNASMVKRTAKRGPNAGGEFWGCPTYPTCRGTRPA